MEAQHPEIDWTRHKSIAIESDDWGACTRTAAPDVAALDKAISLWRRSQFTAWRAWGGGSLETADQMERLFGILRTFRGGDGRPAVFCPAYMVANPDFAAIRKNGFTEYVEIPLSEGYPEGWERPGTLEKAREGMAEGLWYPCYHSRTHHYNGKRWVDILRSNSDPLLRAFFDLNMFGISNPATTYIGREFDDMTPEQMQNHLAGGLSHFHDVFGFMPDCVALEDVVHRRNHIVHTIEDALAILHHLATFDPRTTGADGHKPYRHNTLTKWLNQKIHLNPFGMIEREEQYGAEKIFRDTLTIWAANRPAIVSSHRANYSRLCEAEQMFSFAQLIRYLDTVTTQHPDAVFLTNSEVAQIFKTGRSSVRFGDNIICRNYTGRNLHFEVTLPVGREVETVYNMRSEATLASEQTDQSTLTFAAPDGDFCVVLRSVEAS